MGVGVDLRNACLLIKRDILEESWEMVLFVIVVLRGVHQGAGQIDNPRVEVALIVLKKSEEGSEAKNNPTN